MKKYEHLRYDDFVKIETLLAEGFSVPEIALHLGRSKTTVYRAISRNSSGEGFGSQSAWEKVCERKGYANRHRRIFPESVLDEFIVEKIEINWSPVQIAGSWTQKTGESLSHETVYKFVHEHHPNLVKLYFRRKGKKYRKKGSERYQIEDRRMIDERPSTVEERKEVGHWEGDTIIGKNHQQAIVTNVERRSGLLLASKVERNTAENIFESTRELFKEVPKEFRISMTYDNGKEFSWHKLIEMTTKMTVYFAHAYSPWERGTNENTNGLLREYIPKGSDFSKITDKQLQHYVQLINDRPRKRHGFMSPNQVFLKELESCA